MFVWFLWIWRHLLHMATSDVEVMITDVEDDEIIVPVVRTKRTRTESNDEATESDAPSDSDADSNVTEKEKRARAQRGTKVKVKPEDKKKGTLQKKMKTAVCRRKEVTGKIKQEAKQESKTVQTKQDRRAPYKLAKQKAETKIDDATDEMSDIQMEIHELECKLAAKRREIEPYEDKLQQAQKERKEALKVLKYVNARLYEPREWRPLEITFNPSVTKDLLTTLYKPCPLLRTAWGTDVHAATPDHIAKSPLGLVERHPSSLIPLDLPSTINWIIASYVLYANPPKLIDYRVGPIPEWQFLPTQTPWSEIQNRSISRMVTQTKIEPHLVPECNNKPYLLLRIDSASQ